MSSIGGDLAAGPFNAAGTSDGWSVGGAWGGGADGWGTETGGGFDWGGNISNWLKLVPNVIASAKGNPYASGQFGQGSYPTAGGGGGGQPGVYAGGSLLGASGFGQISGTTLLLIGLGVIFLLKRK
jgi:hypothetical protein